jgi:hypothetical protein
VFHEIWGISWLAEKLLASQRLYSMQLVMFFIYLSFSYFKEKTNSLTVRQAPEVTDFVSWFTVSPANNIPCCGTERSSIVSVHCRYATLRSFTGWKAERLRRRFNISTPHCDVSRWLPVAQRRRKSSPFEWHDKFQDRYFTMRTEKLVLEQTFQNCASSFLTLYVRKTANQLLNPSWSLQPR